MILIRTKSLHQPGIEPGSVPWQGTILPLDHWCTKLLDWSFLHQHDSFCFSSVFHDFSFQSIVYSSSSTLKQSLILLLSTHFKHVPTKSSKGYLLRSCLQFIFSTRCFVSHVKLQPGCPRRASNRYRVCVNVYSENHSFLLVMTASSQVDGKC